MSQLKCRNITEGDTVLLRQQKNELSTTYDPRPYTMKQKKGLSLILQHANLAWAMRYCIEEGDVVTVLTQSAGGRAQMFMTTVLKSFGKCLIELEKKK